MPHSPLLWLATCQLRPRAALVLEALPALRGVAPVRLRERAELGQAIRPRRRKAAPPAPARTHRQAREAERARPRPPRAHLPRQSLGGRLRTLTQPRLPVRPRSAPPQHRRPVVDAEWIRGLTRGRSAGSWRSSPCWVRGASRSAKSACPVQCPCTPCDAERTAVSLEVCDRSRHRSELSRSSRGCVPTRSVGLHNAPT